tara:strand:- start:104 stop:307 length:204 start_codon:yes stop_codon:yes gene_type:complete
MAAARKKAASGRRVTVRKTVARATAKRTASRATAKRTATRARATAKRTTSRARRGGCGGCEPKARRK